MTTSNTTLKAKLRTLVEDAAPYLANIKPYLTPIQSEEEDDLEYIGILERLRDDLSEETQETKIIYDGMMETDKIWTEQRKKLSAQEHAKDVLQNDAFCMETDYVRVMSNIGKYARTLHRTLEKLDRKILSLKGPVETIHNVSRASGGSDATEAPARPYRRYVNKLPKQELPKFSGDLCRWMEFWSQFEALVDSDPDFTPIQKMGYLKQCLTGRALDSIRQFSMTGEDYASAVRFLKEEFGNPRMIKFELNQRLLNIKECSGSTMDLRRFLNELNDIILQLEKMDEDVNNLTLTSAVNKKLPRFLVNKLIDAEAELEDGELWDLTKMRKELRKLLKKMELSDQVLTHADRQPKREPIPFKRVSDPGPSGWKNPRPTTMFAAQATNDFGEKIGIKDDMNSAVHKFGLAPGVCIFCRTTNQHSWEDCPLGFRERLEALRVDRRCYKCMKAWPHQSEEAKDACERKTCSICHGNRHHKLICAKNGKARKSDFRGNGGGQRDYRQPKQNVHLEQSDPYDNQDFARKAPDADQ